MQKKVDSNGNIVAIDTIDEVVVDLLILLTQMNIAILIF